MEDRISSKEQKENEEENKIEHNKVSDNEIGVLEFQQIDDNERALLKGDAIGETLYSARWIFKTLLSLQKIDENGWDSSMEDDLCMLWDMTSDKNIVEFLLENQFLEVAEFVLQVSKEPRLTEIIIGIIGNICCEKKSLDILGTKNDLVKTILNLLINSDDKETLIQILRILHAAVWDIKKNSQSVWLQNIQEFKLLGEAIAFILKSSTSEELLSPCIDFVYLISEVELINKEDFLKNVFGDINLLIVSLQEAMNELLSDTTFAKTQFKNIENWFNIVFKIIKKNLLILSDETCEPYQNIERVLEKILQPFENVNNLILMQDQCFFCIQESIQLISTFQKNDFLPNLILIRNIVNIMVNLRKGMADNELKDCEEDAKQLYDYCVNFWIEVLKALEKDKILQILRECDQATVDAVIKIIESMPDLPESCTTKLLQNLSI